MLHFTREALMIGTFAVRWYGVIIALGALLGVCLMGAREKRYGLEKDTALSACLWAVPAGLVCARIYYVAFSWDFYREHLESIWRIREGGMAIYGGVIGGVLAGYLYARKHRAPFWTLADLAAPALALAQGLGRWGNFINREAYGAQIANPKWQFFPVAVYIPAENGHFAATFFYESAWCFLICALILLLEKRRAFRFPGAAAAFYACMYAFERCVVESLRTDSLYWGGVRVSQALSALALVSVAFLLILRARKGRARAALFALIALSAAGLFLCAARPAAFGLGLLLPSALAGLFACFAAYARGA